jgi:hypothetical protein
MGFASLQHIRRRRSTSRGPKPPASFRPQGLVTLSTVSSLRRRAGFVSCRRRSWDSPFGAFSSWKVPARFRVGEPTYRSAQRYSPSSEDVGPARWAAVPGLWPFRESLAIQRVFSPQIAGCSLGLRPSRVFRPRPGPGFRRGSSRALRRVRLLSWTSVRLRVSIGPGLASSFDGQDTACG